MSQPPAAESGTLCAFVLTASPGGRILRSADDSHEVLLFLEWDDLERACLFVDSDDLREAMMRAGVTDRPDIYFLTDGEHIPV